MAHTTLHLYSFTLDFNELIRSEMSNAPNFLFRNLHKLHFDHEKSGLLKKWTMALGPTIKR